VLSNELKVIILRCPKLPEGALKNAKQLFSA